MAGQIGAGLTAEEKAKLEAALSVVQSIDNLDRTSSLEGFKIGLSDALRLLRSSGQCRATEPLWTHLPQPGWQNYWSCDSSVADLLGIDENAIARGLGLKLDELMP